MVNSKSKMINNDFSAEKISNAWGIRWRSDDQY